MTQCYITAIHGNTINDPKIGQNTALVFDKWFNEIIISIKGTLAIIHQTAFYQKQLHKSIKMT